MQDGCLKGQGSCIPAPKQNETGLEMLYIILDNKKYYLDNITAKKYNLKAGMYTPFTNHEIYEDDKKEDSDNVDEIGQETYTV